MHPAAAEANATERATALLDPIRAFCRQARLHSRASTLTIEGLLPLHDALLDRPLTPKEFKFEPQRQQSRQPRWPSLLQAKELRALADDCPGARGLIAFRKQCVGYFLAE